MTQVFKIEKVKKSVNWTEEEDKLLISLASTHKKKWSLISKGFKDKTGYHCHQRYQIIDPCIKKGAWEPIEDQKIIEGMRHYSKQWSKIASEYFSDRTGKQVRDRYTNNLDPEINKSKFTIEEDLRILDLYKKYGKRWSLFKQFIPGRSSDSIKNRFNSSIKQNKKLSMVLGYLTFSGEKSNCLIMETSEFNLKLPI
jgi:myb proto-oncogene protein